MMTQNTVSNAAIICMATVGVLTLCIPVALLFWFRKKKKADLVPFFIGMAVMFLFAYVLEVLVHQLVLNVLPVGQRILNNIWLYALYGGMMAGLFEETGRFLAFKTILKRYRGKDINALMYGAGHGGMEAAMVLGSAMISNIVLAVMINNNMTSVITSQATEATLPQIEATLDTLRNTAPGMYFVSLLERVLAVPLQLALSVLVWFAAKQNGKWYLYPVAILLHFLVDAILVVVSHYLTLIWLIYVILIAETVPVVLLAYAVWKRNAKIEESA